MSYSYTPFDPVIWFIFIVFFFSTYLIIKAFHRRYPNYPKGAEKDKD